MTVRANKRLGQHFLNDEQVSARIVAAVSPQPGQTLVEIGPGLGALTTPVLASGARLEAVEIDTALADRLAQQFADHPMFVLHRCDALNFKFSELAINGRIRIIGNLPYNISTPILMRLFNAHQHIVDMHLMLQTEVAERVAAQAGARSYSRLSVAAACFGKVQYLFDVAPGAFSPPPSVSSTLIRLVPQPRPLDDRQRHALLALVKRAFAQRRKTIRQIFSTSLDDGDLARLKLAPAARPETLTLDDFLGMLKLLNSKGVINAESVNDENEKPIQH